MESIQTLFTSSVQKEFAEERRAINAFVEGDPRLRRHFAEPLFLARYAEKAGSGILDMIARCKAVGLPLARFRQEGGQFVQTLPRPRRSRPSSKAQEAQEAQEAQGGLSSVEMLMLKAGARHPQSGRHLLSATGYKARTGNFKRGLDKLLSAHLMEMTIPQKPTSQQQRYRTTKKGRQLLSRSQLSPFPTALEKTR